MIIIKKKFGFHNFAEHRLRTSGLISFRVKISIRSTGYPRSCVRTYAESCLAASWQSGPWEGQRSCGIKGFPLSPTAGADLPREASCVGDHTYGLSRDRRAPKHSRMILARRQSETNANLINQKAPDNSHAFCFPFSLSLFLFVLLRSRDLYLAADLYSRTLLRPCCCFSSILLRVWRLAHILFHRRTREGRSGWSVMVRYIWQMVKKLVVWFVYGEIRFIAVAVVYRVGGS